MVYKRTVKGTLESSSREEGGKKGLGHPARLASNSSRAAMYRRKKTDFMPVA